MIFADRTHGGRELAARVSGLGQERPIVFGLPRGGVPVAAEIARALAAPLEVLVVRKLGAPRNRELAVGAVAEGGTAVVDRGIARRVRLTAPAIEELLEREECELRRQVARFREPARARRRPRAYGVGGRRRPGDRSQRPRRRASPALAAGGRGSWSPRRWDRRRP